VDSSVRVQPSSKRLHYAWIVAITTFFLLIVSSSTRGVYSLLIEPLMTEFGWSRSVTSVPASVNIFMYGMMGPFAASLMAKFGLRRIVCGALVFIATGAALTSQVRHPWQLILSWGVVVGLGMGCMASVLASTVANTWFVARRGQVTGMLMASTTAGQLMFTQLNRSLVEDHSWRFASVIVMIATVAGIPIALLFLRNRPEDKGTRAYGAPEGYESPAKPAGAVRLAFSTLRDIRGSGMFWILFGGFWVCGVTTWGMVQTHWFEATADHNYSKVTAANLLVVIGVCDVLGSLGSGWLCDRVDPRKLLFAYYGLRALSLFVLDRVLDFGSTHMGLLIVIAFYGLDWVATVPPTIALANELFGRQRGGIVYGWLFAAHQLGGALAAWFSAASRDWTGSFSLSYVIGGVFCLAAAFGSLGIGRKPHQWTPTLAVGPA
jgi:MFS family permease